MPTVLLPCDWVLSWNESDPLKLIVYHTENQTTIFSGTAERFKLQMLIDSPEFIEYDIEEDGEVMELRLTIQDEQTIYTLYSKYK